MDSQRAGTQTPVIGVLLLQVSRIFVVTAAMLAFLDLVLVAELSLCSTPTCGEEEAARLGAAFALNGLLYLGWLLGGSVALAALVLALRRGQWAWVIALVLVAAVGVAGLAGAVSESGVAASLAHRAVIAVLGEDADWGRSWLVAAAALLLVCLGGAAYTILGQRGRSSV